MRRYLSRVTVQSGPCPGELVFVPEGWLHATRNEGGGPTLGVGLQVRGVTPPFYAAIGGRF